MEMGETVYLSFDDVKKRYKGFRNMVSTISNKIKSSPELFEFQSPQKSADTVFAEYQRSNAVNNQ